MVLYSDSELKLQASSRERIHAVAVFQSRHVSAPITRSGIHANGFLTAAFQPDLNCSCRSHPDRDENAQLARFFNLLAHYTGEKGDQNIASRAMRYLATPEIATADLSAPVLLAEMQFTHTPLPS